MDVKTFSVTAPTAEAVAAQKLSTIQTADASCKTVVLNEFFIELKLANSSPPYAILADYTGKNKLVFPQCIEQMTPAWRRALNKVVADFI